MTNLKFEVFISLLETHPKLRKMLSSQLYLCSFDSRLLCVLISYATNQLFHFLQVQELGNQLNRSHQELREQRSKFRELQRSYDSCSTKNLRDTTRNNYHVRCIQSSIVATGSCSGTLRKPSSINNTG